MITLNKRITIQQRTKTRDASGGFIESWANLIAAGDGKVWAGVKNLSGNDRRASSHGGVVSEARTEFTVRFLASITAQMRISYSGKIYNIKHVNDFNEGHRFMILTCDTGVNDG